MELLEEIKEIDLISLIRFSLIISMTLTLSQGEHKHDLHLNESESLFFAGFSSIIYMDANHGFGTF